MRAAHPDNHYCAASFRLLREFILKYKDTTPTVVLFVDDKAKVPLGSPGAPISTGVRGKKQLCPTSMNFGALDHDMHKTSLTPSVFLVQSSTSIPKEVEDSWVTGQVY